jgi:hypothetical protein
MACTRWTSVACLAVVFAGFSNAHLHYCFDGQEPPVSVHLTDGIDRTHTHHERTSHGAAHDLADHDTGHHDPEHHDDLDVDLKLANQALAKALKFDQPAIAALDGWSIPIEPFADGALIDIFEAPPVPEPFHILPRPRGPPA